MKEKSNILGKRLRGLREDNDLKQNKVAEDMSITPFQLSRYESGHSKPDPELIANFATYYEVTTDYLLGHSDQPNLPKDETFDSFEEIKKLADDLGVEDLSFFDIDEWKNLSKEDFEDVMRTFKLVAYRAKHRKDDNTIN